jgi:copper chaperone CopZ
MNCSLCPISVSKALTGVPGVIDASAELASKRAVVNYDPEKITPEQLAGAVICSTAPTSSPGKWAWCLMNRLVPCNRYPTLGNSGHDPASAIA